MPITLIVEDGTCSPGANTYASQTTADSWAGMRGITTWAGATADEKAMALVRATDYLNGLKWVGKKVDDARVFAWPRVGVAGVPAQVVEATCYLATQLNATGTNPGDAQDRPLSSIQVGPISLDWESGTTDGVTYPALNGILVGLLQSSTVSTLTW